ncbi:unnamed protein product [Camellia sinensis]
MATDDPDLIILIIIVIIMPNCNKGSLKRRRRLDDEFNEVVKCYKRKVEEVMEDAKELNKQMDALIALRFRVDNPAMGSRTSEVMNLAANGKKPVLNRLICGRIRGVGSRQMSEIESRIDLEQEDLFLHTESDSPYGYVVYGVGHICFISCRGVAMKGDILEDPANEPNKDTYMMTIEPEDAPNQPEYVQIGMVSGLPVSVNGKEFSPASLLSELNEIGGHIIFVLFKNLTMMSFIDCMVDPRTCINVTPCIVQLGKTILKVSPGSSNASGSSSSKEQHNQQYPVPEVKCRKRHRRKHFENQKPCLMRGVYFKNMKWQAAIKVDKKQIYLGTVGSQEAAARLYDRDVNQGAAAFSQVSNRHLLTPHHGHLPKHQDIKTREGLSTLIRQDQGLEVISEGLDTLKNMAHDLNEEMDRQVPLMDGLTLSLMFTQDQGLEVISEGLDKLKDMARDLNEEIDRQVPLMDGLTLRVDNATSDLKNTNVRLKDTVSQKTKRIEVRSHMDVIQEAEMSTEGNIDDEVRPDNEPESSTNHSKAGVVGFRPPSLKVLNHVKINVTPETPLSTLPSLKVLNHVKINVTPETPLSTLKTILMSSKSDLSFSKGELRKVEEQMRQAFIEFYQKLLLLKSYWYHFKECFEGLLGDDRQTLALMRFFLWLLYSAGSGYYCAHTWERYIYGQDVGSIWKIYFHFTGILFGFIDLHMIMFSGNNFWRHFRVNYAFIFGFKKGMELGYREVLLVSSGLAVLTLAGVISNLDMDMDPRTGRSFRTTTELVPLGLVTVQALRCSELYICYYGWGDFNRRSKKCSKSDVFNVFYIIVAVVPYWVRFIQCLRRLVEERDSMHALNGLKYFSTIIAVVMRTGNDLKWGKTWKILATTSSGVAIIASTYWDIVIDWGLLRRNSRNPWLRDKLLISNKSVYFVAIVSTECALRFAWMQSVLGLYDMPFPNRTAITAIVACLEIIRRGIWNFFSAWLENEHLNNVGKYRAFKSVPYLSTMTMKKRMYNYILHRTGRIAVIIT